ncbi:MAG: calcium-binding protein, partial [Nitrososphaera sp.]
MRPSRDGAENISIAIFAAITAVLVLVGGDTVTTEPVVRDAHATTVTGYTLGDTPSEIAQENENDNEGDSDTPIIVGKENNNDVLQGTESRDIIIGLGGNDLIFGNGGDDILCGAAGNDIVVGGAGNDTIMGDMANDTLIGGDIACKGAAGDDT